jgi:GntR family transcriptional repressor for pyruvate dehydrogenase complex
MTARSLVEETQRKIQQMILNKEYDSNNYLPSEGEMCEQFGVSRITVRDAVRSMEVRGFVRREHGKGILVTDNNVQAMTQFITDMLSMNHSDLVDVVEVREIVDTAAARMAAERSDEKDIARLQLNLEIMEQSETMDDPYYTNDMEFHVNLVKATKNRLLLAMANAYIPILKEMVITSSQREYNIELHYHFHGKILECIRAKDCETAADTMKRHHAVTRKNFNECMDLMRGESFRMKRKVPTGETSA